jgi:hypothetical protein
MNATSGSVTGVGSCRERRHLQRDGLQRVGLSNCGTLTLLDQKSAHNRITESAGQVGV